MTEPNSAAPYYEGRGFPLGTLSPAEFESFVFGCLLCIQDVLGLHITGMPSGTGDGGFDVQGEVISSKRLVCVQCKRQKEPLGTPKVAEELAKVAATVALEGSDVGEHRFICTGGVRDKLTHQLRETPREQLAYEAGERLTTAEEGELLSLRTRLEQRGDDPRRVAESYVLGLDLLVAWGLPEFDSALSPRWSDVLKVVERYFRIASVVREYPRASFDRASYCSRSRGFTVVVEPRLAESSLPEGILVPSLAEAVSDKPRPSRTIHSLADLETVEPGELVILLGDGGVGKSTVLRLLRARILRSSSESTLPVIISLTNYTAGALDRMVHQALGVDYGSWLLLPDRVLLMCDGLNECPSAQLGAFLEELRPLLDRCRVSCVLSTRETTRHNKVVLPSLVSACVKLQGITPIGIRRMAEHDLPSEAATAFVETFRALADSSGSPLLWTPFAVNVGLGIWKQNMKLPGTLGEMLETLLRARCERNNRSPEHVPGPEVTLRLAGAVAFQCLMVDHRLECRANEAGKCIREARTYCSDAFGVADMKETEIVDLLTRNELLVSVAGNLSFGHQLLAGALAAPILAEVWRQHSSNLGEPITDDAWIFLARLIPSEQVSEFLQSVFNIDLMLGARAARELSNEFRLFAESLLEQTVSADSETVQVQGLFALARLRSSGTIAILRRCATDNQSPTQYAAQRALAAASDIEYLSRLLPEVDRLRSGPVRVSGGEVTIWESAPFPTRLDLARSRLTKCDLGDPVGESLSLVAYEQDPSDTILVESHLSAAKSPSAWQSAIWALNEISPSRAKERLADALKQTQDAGEKGSIIQAAALMGVEVDLHNAFDCAVTELAPDDRGNFFLAWISTEPNPTNTGAGAYCAKSGGIGRYPVFNVM